MPQWDEQQYLQFFDERTRAARELLARVPLDTADYVIDLGCGPGNSTQLLRHRWLNARIVGVDSSAEMLARARADWPEGEWVRSDVVDFKPVSAPDLVFANALFQWLPDHGSVCVNLLQQLRSGGVLAVQMPRNFAEPSHRLMRELGSPWDVPFLMVQAASPVHTAAHYYDLLAPHASRVDIWQTTYEHVMPDVASIVEWVKGTGIRPFLAALTVEEQSAYLTAYAQALETAYPPRSDGKRLFSFPRIFVVAIR